MVVLVTNITDAPGGKHSPRQVDVHNKTLDPGGSVRLPAELIDKRVRLLADEGLIAIGALPSWYTAAKARPGRRLTDEEKRSRNVRPKVLDKKKDKDKIVPLPIPETRVLEKDLERAVADANELNQRKR